jgi:hypothetical protein
MPTYGEKKKKDIIESVLPCTRNAAQSFAKDIRRVKQNERRKVSHAITNMYSRGATADAVIESYDDQAFDWNYKDPNKTWMVRERRDHDNLGALLRWAPTQIEDVRVQDRASKIKAMLPNNTIGRHAAGHVADLSEFEVDHPSLNPWKHYFSAEALAEDRWIEYAEWHNRLVILCENGKLSDFNDMRLAHKQVRTHISHDEYHQRRRDGRLDSWNEGYWTYYSRPDESYVVLSYQFLPLLGRKEIPDFIAEAFHRRYRAPSNYDKMVKTIKELTV